MDSIIIIMHPFPTSKWGRCRANRFKHCAQEPNIGRLAVLGLETPILQSGTQSLNPLSCYCLIYEQCYLMICEFIRLHTNQADL